MSQSQKYSRLNEINHFPRLEDLRMILSEALRNRGCTVELPWRSARTGKFYSITGVAELTAKDVVWTLYLGEGAAATPVWSTGFNDLEMLIDVMVLSLPDETEQTKSFSQGQPQPNPYQYLPAHPSYPAHPGPPAQQVSGTYPVVQGYPPPGPVPPGYPPMPVNYPPPGYPLSPGMTPGAMPAAGYPPYPATPGYPPNYPPMPGQAPMPAPHSAPFTPQQTAASSLPSRAVPTSNPATAPSGSRQGTETPASKPLPPDSELLKKRANVKLGQFLVQADLVPERTLEAALFLQDLVKGNVLTTTQAAEALARAHNRGGTLESNIFLAKPKPMDGPPVTLPLGQILVEAGLISKDALAAALNLQDAARTGVMSAQEALDAFVKDTYKRAASSESSAQIASDPSQQDAVQKLLIQSGAITPQDIQVAQKVEVKHGGNILNILFAAGKIEQSTIDAATELLPLIEKKKLKEEQAIMALDYCQRSRVTLKEALQELRWTV